MYPLPLPPAPAPALLCTWFIVRERLVRLRQYHDAHTVHKVLSKLQPVEEETFLAAYNAQVGVDRTRYVYMYMFI